MILMSELNSWAKQQTSANEKWIDLTLFSLEIVRKSCDNNRNKYLYTNLNKNVAFFTSKYFIHLRLLANLLKVTGCSALVLTSWSKYLIILLTLD